MSKVDPIDESSSAYERMRMLGDVAVVFVAEGFGPTDKRVASVLRHQDAALAAVKELERELAIAKCEIAQLMREGAK
jgi:hypothetical protein